MRRVSIPLLLVTLAACGSSSSAPVTSPPSAEPVSCASLDPLDALSRKLDGPVSIRSTWLRNGRADKGEYLFIDEVFESDGVGLRRYATETRVPLNTPSPYPYSTLQAYTEVVVDDTFLYARLTEEALPAAAGRWVRADVTDEIYLNYLVPSPGPYPQTLPEYLDLRLNNLNEWFNDGPSSLSGPPEEFEAKENAAWSKPGRCAYVVSGRDAPDVLRVFLDTSGRVVAAESTGFMNQGEGYWLTVSYDPVLIDVPGDDDLAPEDVGRKYVADEAADLLVLDARLTRSEMLLANVEQSSQAYLELLDEMETYSAPLTGFDKGITQRLRGADGAPQIVWENERRAAEIPPLDPVMRHVEISRDGATVCVSTDESLSEEAGVTAGPCDW